MASPDPNPYFGCLVMLSGIAFVLFAVWETRFSLRSKITITLLMGAVVLPLSYRSLSAAAVFAPRITSAIFKSSAQDGTVPIQLWADVENKGDKPGLIESWSLSAITSDQKTITAVELYGQPAISGDGKEIPVDPLADKTENSPLLPGARASGHLFFIMNGTSQNELAQPTTVLKLQGKFGENGHFCVMQTVFDIQHNRIDPKNCF